MSVVSRNHTFVYIWHEEMLNHNTFPLLQVPKYFYTSHNCGGEFWYSDTTNKWTQTFKSTIVKPRRSYSTIIESLLKKEATVEYLKRDILNNVIDWKTHNQLRAPLTCPHYNFSNLTENGIDFRLHLKTMNNGQGRELFSDVSSWTLVDFCFVLFSK